MVSLKKYIFPGSNHQKNPEVMTKPIAVNTPSLPGELAGQKCARWAQSILSYQIAEGCSNTTGAGNKDTFWATKRIISIADWNSLNMFKFMHSYHTMKKKKNLYWPSLEDARKPCHNFENPSTKGKVKHWSCPPYTICTSG